MKNVMMWVGAGQIGMAIARRVGFNSKIIVGDKSLGAAESAARTLREAGFDIEACEMDPFDREFIVSMIDFCCGHRPSPLR